MGPMLSCHILDNPDQKKEVLHKFMEGDTCWIVNDLQTKFWMQSLIRDYHQKVISGDQVLRASELWQQMLLKEEPYWQIINPDLAQFFIEKWLGDAVRELKLSLSTRDRKKAYQTIGQVLPLLCHFQGDDVMEEWFSQSDEAKERWYEWYRAGQFLWERFFDKKLIPSEWIKGALINKDLVTDKERFVFDLGLDIDDVESELILNLSRITDVEVIIPSTEEIIEPYESLISRCLPENLEKQEFEVKKTYKKLPSMLSEVKDAVSQVRLWIEQDVELEKIAIVSSSIENYWPTLSEYLLVEGIKFNKNIVAPLSQYEVYQSWLSSMRFALADISSADGKQMFYNESDEPEVNFTQYKQLFKNVYGKDDFNRLKELKERLPQTINSKEKVSFSQFMDWAIPLFKKEKVSQLDQLLQSFDEIYIIEESLSYEKWVEFFENHFSRTEKTIERLEGKGISILSPAGAQNIPIDKMIFLGLSEQNLIESQDTALHWTDIESIKVKFGFTLPHADRFKLLQVFKWLDKKNISEVLYYHSETDFSGRFQSPSLYWLQGAIEGGHDLEIEAPGKTRWDQLMQFEPDVDLKFNENHLEKIDFFIKRDLGEESTQKAKVEKLSLSASTLEEYFKCPFRFFAIKGLRLSDLPAVDLDIDYQTRGRLIHKICEEIVKQNNFSLKDQEINSLVEKARQSIDMEIYNEEMWSFFKPFYFQLAKRFMNFEAQWRNDYPLTKTVATEKFIKTKIVLKDNQITFSTEEEGIPFRGVIDRIDATEDGDYVILDYKSSDSGLTSHKSWLSKGKLQLSLYGLALSEGIVTGKKEELVGAFYYVIKNLDRKKGFSIVDASKEFLPSKKVTKEERDQLIEETQNLSYELIKRLQDGEIEPSPFEPKLCNDCQWNKVCRYPNLNL